MLLQDQGDKIVQHRNLVLDKELQKSAKIDSMIQQGQLDYEREVAAREFLKQ